MTNGNQLDFLTPPSVRYEAYCDGACRGNGKSSNALGGWGFFMRDADTLELLMEHYGGARGTTNNQMELTAAVEVRKNTPPGAQVAIHSDSTYVIKGLTEWISGWIKKGWRTSSGPVKNIELWKELHALYKARTVTLHWVRGHSGDPGNERADELANLGADTAQ